MSPTRSRLCANTGLDFTNSKLRAALVPDSLGSFLRHGWMLLLLTIILVFSRQGYAADVSLEWDLVADARVGGYEVSYSLAAGQHDTLIDVGNVTTTTITGFALDTLYYFAVRAYTSDRSSYSEWSSEVSTTIAAPLSADFSASSTSGSAPLVVTFNDTSTGTVNARRWDFGDGTTAAGSTAVHTYSAAGRYSVSLTVTGPAGSDTEAKPGLIDVMPLPPIVDSTGTDTSGSGSMTGTPTDGDSFVDAGEIELNSNLVRVEFQHPFSDPIVVVNPISGNGSQPAVVRIENVDSTGFSVRVQEWSYLDGEHTTETASYLAVERGTHLLPNGTYLEADEIQVGAAERYYPVAFLAPFLDVPVVVTAVTTVNEPDTVTTRVRRVTTDGFRINLQEQEASDQKHAIETVAYIAWEPSIDEVGGFGFEVGFTADEVTHKAHTIPYMSAFETAPLFIGDMQSADGSDTATLRWAANSGSSISVWVAEEQSRDREVSHTTETVGYVALVPTAIPAPSQ